jgi:hypothetical protein
MEYERAIYRVYERCMEGIREEMEPAAVKYCQIMEYIAVIFAVFFAIVLGVLHVNFASPHSGSYCLQTLLAAQNVSTLGSDQILYININSEFVDHNSLGLGNDDFYREQNEAGSDPYAAAQEVGSEGAAGRRSLLTDSNYYLSGWGKTAQRYIVNNFFDHVSASKYYKRSNTGADVQHNSYYSKHRPHNNDLLAYYNINSWLTAFMRKGSQYVQSSLDRYVNADSINSNTLINRFSNYNRRFLATAAQATNGTNSSATNSTIIYPTYDYEFAFDVAILALSMEQRAQHNFKSINVTFANVNTYNNQQEGAEHANNAYYQCFGSSKVTQSLLTSVGSLDVVVLNNIVNTFQKSGRFCFSHGICADLVFMF